MLKFEFFIKSVTLSSEKHSEYLVVRKHKMVFRKLYRDLFR